MARDKSTHVAPDFDERYPNASARATEGAMNLVLGRHGLSKVTIEPS